MSVGHLAGHTLTIGCTRKKEGQPAHLLPLDKGRPSQGSLYPVVYLKVTNWTFANLKLALEK